MERMDFAHAVARIRVIEKRLLNRSTIEKLLECEDETEVFRVLQDTSYGSRINELEAFHDYEGLLREELSELYSTLNKIAPTNKVIDIMALKYDYHNIKVLIKGKALDKDLSHLLVNLGVLPIEKLKNFIINGEVSSFNDRLTDRILKVEKAFEESGNPQIIDILLDRFMYEHMLAEAEGLNVEFLSSYVRQAIDIQNIKTMLRVQQQKKSVRFLEESLLLGGTIDAAVLTAGLSMTLEEFAKAISKTPYSQAIYSVLQKYGEMDSMASLEVLYDNHIMQHAREAKKISLGPEPLIAYIIAKETDVRILRIIIVGKINKVNSEVIRERLRELYA